MESTITLQERQQGIEEQLRKAQKNAILASGSGILVAEALREQGEKIDSIEKNLGDQEADIDKSLHIMRGMTWSGSIYNGITGVIETVANGSSKVVSNILGNDTKQEHSKSTLDTTNYVNHQPSTYQGENMKSSHNSSTSTVSTEEQILNDISRQLDLVKNLSITIGENLEQQSTQLEQVSQKSDQLHDKTLQATVRASKLTANKSKEPMQIRCLGTYVFMTPYGLLSVSNRPNNTTAIDFIQSVSKSAIFMVYVKGGSILGLQSCSTEKYLGVTSFGMVAISGEYFGSQEEVYVDLSGRESGLLLFARNWGAGGWIRSPRALQDNAGYEIPTSSGISDKKDLLKFCATKVDYIRH